MEVDLSQGPDNPLIRHSEVLAIGLLEGNLESIIICKVSPLGAAIKGVGERKYVGKAVIHGGGTYINWGLRRRCIVWIACIAFRDLIPIWRATGAACSALAVRRSGGVSPPSNCSGRSNST
jgi:hypothetical protein